MAALLLAACAAPKDDDFAAAGATNVELADIAEAKTIPTTDAFRRHSNGTILSLKGSNLSQDLESRSDYLSLMDAGAFGDQAIYFLAAYRSEFHLANPISEFFVDEVKTDDLGYRQVRLHQKVASLPVRNAEVLVGFNPQGHIYLVQGRYIATPWVLGGDSGAEQAQSAVITRYATAESIAEQGRTILLQAGGDSYLAYEYLVTLSAINKKSVFIDANSLELLLEVDVVVR